MNWWTEISVIWMSNVEWCSHPKPKYAWSIYHINDINWIVSPVTSIPPLTVTQLTTTTINYTGIPLITYITTKQQFHTSIYSFNPFMRASHTSGTIIEINCLEILKRYIKLVYESPVARKRSVTANLSLIGIVSLKFVSLLAI